MEDIQSKSDKEILNIAHQLRVAYVLKRTIRYGANRNTDSHNESVAEHIFALLFLAEYFLRIEPAGSSLNAETLYQILLFHDFSEIKHGDIVTYHKTKDTIERERIAAKDVFASLPPPLDTIGYERWAEYETQTNPEARFAYALDKIEPLFELLDPVNERSMRRLKITYKMNTEHKRKAVQEFPVMRRFVEVLSKNLNERGVFWKEIT